MADKDDGRKAGVEPNYGSVPRPSHVDPALVVDFDYLAPIPQGADNYQILARLQRHGHDIVWTPRNGGHWIATRGEDIRWVQENYQIFSHEVFNIRWEPHHAEC